jgi:diaminopimelate epimerase
VELKMSAVDSVEQDGAAFVLNTGSPHYVRFVEGLADKDMLQEGRAVRYGPRFAAAGINVNLVEEMPDMPHIRTYERGVEGETLACGTGVTAAAIATFLRRGAPLGRFSTKMRTRGAVLELRFEAMPGGKFDDIWLCGPARMVFQGEI